MKVFTYSEKKNSLLHLQSTPNESEKKKKKHKKGKKKKKNLKEAQKECDISAI